MCRDSDFEVTQTSGAQTYRSRHSDFSCLLTVLYLMMAKKEIKVNKYFRFIPRFLITIYMIYHVRAIYTYSTYGALITEFIFHI